MRWRRGGEGLREECLYGVFVREGGEGGGRIRGREGNFSISRRESEGTRGEVQEERARTRGDVQHLKEGG